MKTTFKEHKEQREYRRYAQPDDAVVVCNRQIGRAINISEGGMAVNWLGDSSFPGDGTVTILSNSKERLINDLPVRFLSARNEHSSNRAIKVKRTGVSFNFANPKQQREIKEYIDELATNSQQELQDN
jgi:c-di-GMP-binding flagellar brake protein YcgR